jgi:hypothetical protein
MGPESRASDYSLPNNIRKAAGIDEPLTEGDIPGLKPEPGAADPEAEAETGEEDEE